MNILLLEDDRLQAEQIERDLRSAMKPEEINITRIATEYAFREEAERLAATSQADSLPDVAVLDVMVRWTDPAPEMPQMPLEVKHGKHYSAGLRCAAFLAARLPRLPIVIFSVLERQEVEGLSKAGDLGDVTIVTKTSEIHPLVAVLRRILAGTVDNNSD